jgi:hypothetical protein
MTIRDKLQKQRLERQLAMLEEQKRKDVEKREDLLLLICLPTTFIGMIILYYVFYVFLPEGWM